MGQSLSGDAAIDEAVGCLKMALGLLDRKGFSVAACYVSNALDELLSEQKSRSGFVPADTNTLSPVSSFDQLVKATKMA